MTDQFVTLDEALKDSEFCDILEECRTNTAVLAKVLFPETFECEFSGLHDQIFDLIDNSNARKIVISAPRGIGKTTIARTLATRSILFKDKKFVCYVSKSETSAIMQTENMKTEMQTNDMIKKLFGAVKAKKAFGVEESFSKKSWVALNNTMVLPRGSGQQIRGLNWIRYRPDLFIFDDLEDTKTLGNEVIRQARREWFFADAVKAIPLTHKNWRIIYIDTVKHEDALIEELLDDPDWESLRLSICTDEYKTLAPAFMSQEDLDKELEKHREQHLMDIFAREFQSRSISAEARSFSSKHFQYYSEDEEEFQKRDDLGAIESVVIVDPAKTAKMDSAETGYAVWGVDLETNRLYFRHGLGAKLHPDQVYTQAFEFCQQFRANTLAVEVTGLNEFISHPFRNEMIRLNLNYDFVELSAHGGRGGELGGTEGGKKGRVRSLIGYYRKGLIYHNKIGSGSYEAQLMSFPRPKRWDIMDAAAYIIQIMDMGLRYFQPLEALEEKAEDIEKEYASLKNEDAIDSNEWRYL